MNIFSINNIDITTEKKDIIIRKVIINASLVKKCNKHGNILMEAKIKTEAYGMSDEAAIITAANKFFDNEYDERLDIYNTKCKCVKPVITEITHFNFSELQKPFKNLFEGLFKNSSWATLKW